MLAAQKSPPSETRRSVKTDHNKATSGRKKLKFLPWPAIPHPLISRRYFVMEESLVFSTWLSSLLSPLSSSFPFLLRTRFKTSNCSFGPCSHSPGKWDPNSSRRKGRCSLTYSLMHGSHVLPPSLPRDRCRLSPPAPQRARTRPGVTMTTPRQETQHYSSFMFQIKYPPLSVYVLHLTWSAFILSSFYGSQKELFMEQC